MDQALWTAVDNYIVDKLIPHDPILEAALAANARAELMAIDVAPNQGKFLYVLARLMGAKRILELGTLGGYSTIWLARALPPEGRLITLELQEKHAGVAAENIHKAGLSDRVEIRVGSALASLAVLHASGIPPFDLIFIDADKDNYPAYLEWSLRLSRPGTLIVGDNVVRDGAIIDPENADPRVQGIRQFFDIIANNPRLEATALQTLGSKGYDGFALAIVKA